MTDQNKVAQMLEVLADNGFGMYDLAMLFRSLDSNATEKGNEQLLSDEQLELRIKKVLDNIPIIHNKGYELLVTAIRLAYKCKLETGQNICYLEKKVASMYNVEPKAVERTIRNTLETSWRYVDEEVAKKYGIYRTHKIKQCDTGEMCNPSNGMFAIAIANYLLKEDRIEAEWVWPNQRSAVMHSFDLEKFKVVLAM